jgi:1-acyl-sn-glycerol-3-phosphate acyltransferase
VNTQALARRILRTTGWKVQGEPPPDAVAVLVAAPHTSNWDFAVMLLLSRAFGIQAKFLAKQELFRGPLGPFMRWTGGISIDRENPAGVVEQLVEHASSADRFQLVIAAEGTRKPKQYWKSGFYRLAEQADLPICLGFVDGPSRTMGYGPTFRPSGDVRADMAMVRAFYADKRGINPENRTEPRLREEDAPADEPSA